MTPCFLRQKSSAPPMPATATAIALLFGRIVSSTVPGTTSLAFFIATRLPSLSAAQPTRALRLFTIAISHSFRLERGYRTARRDAALRAASRAGEKVLRGLAGGMPRSGDEGTSTSLDAAPERNLCCRDVLPPGRPCGLLRRHTRPRARRRAREAIAQALAAGSGTVPRARAA